MEKVSVSKKELSEMLKLTKPFVMNNQTSVLSKIRFDGKQVMATDLRKSVIVPMDVGIRGCVSHKELSEIVKKTTVEWIEIWVDELDDGAKLNLETSDYSISMAMEDTYPNVVPSPEGLDFQQLPEDFRVATGYCVDFASTDETRYSLNGVYVDQKAAVAADDHRMAKYELGETGLTEGMIVPTNVVRAFLSMDLDQYAFTEDGKVWFAGPSGWLCGSLVEGTFPDYRKITDADYGDPEAEILLTRSAIIGSDIVRVFGDSTNGKKVRVTASEDVMKIESHNDLGNAAFNVPIEYTGPEIAFNVNFDYFASAVMDEEVTMRVYTRDASGGYMLVFDSGLVCVYVMTMMDD